MHPWDIDGQIVELHRNQIYMTVCILFWHLGKIYYIYMSIHRKYDTFFMFSLHFLLRAINPLSTNSGNFSMEKNIKKH